MSSLRSHKRQDPVPEFVTEFKINVKILDQILMFETDNECWGEPAVVEGRGHMAGVGAGTLRFTPSAAIQNHKA